MKLAIGQKRKVKHPIGHVDTIVQSHGKEQTVCLGHSNGEKPAHLLLAIKVPVFLEVFLGFGLDPFFAKGVDP